MEFVVHPSGINRMNSMIKCVKKPKFEITGKFTPDYSKIIPISDSD